MKVLKAFTLLIVTVVSCHGLIAQETMKTKLRPLIENYLKREPEYRNCIISSVAITNISIIDEKEKNKSLYDFYRAYRLKQMEELAFIKSKVDYIDQHCTDDKTMFKKYVAEIDTTLRETAPLVDSLWAIEDKYKNAVIFSPNAEYYFVTFDFSYTLNNSKVNEKAHRVLFTGQMDIIHHDYLNR